MIVTGGPFAGDFLKLLGNGSSFGLKHLNYSYQEGEGGIADALSLAEYFASNELICVILGDNLIECNIKHAVDNFKTQGHGARILLKEVEDAQRFGVAEIRNWLYCAHNRKTKESAEQSSRHRYILLRFGSF